MLNKQEIEKLIKDKKLIEGYIDLATQLTPNGFDLTVSSIAELDAPGAVDFSNKERVVPEGRDIVPEKTDPLDKFGWWILKKGIYKVKTNETVNLPLDLTAMAFTRTTLLRMGAFTQHGVWDAGYKGKSEFVLVVENPAGIRIKQNARIAQLIFKCINAPECGYQGIYQNTK
jgi:dUTP pyrophosphatase